MRPISGGTRTSRDGANLIQQHDTIFATFFIYGTDGRARWYTASALRGNGAPADALMVFRGRLFETTAPAVTNAPFDPANVTRRDVGEVFFQYMRPNNGIITYTIDGVTVSKQVRRQTWAEVDITGDFYLNRVLRPHLCNGPNRGDEPSINEPGTMTVARSGSTVQITTRPVAPSTLACTYTGPVTQEGRMSAVEGTYSCNDGSSGAFSIREIEASKWGFMGRISANVRGCNMHGHFGGARMTVAELPS